MLSVSASEKMRNIILLIAISSLIFLAFQQSAHANSINCPFPAVQCTASFGVVATITAQNQQMQPGAYSPVSLSSAVIQSGVGPGGYQVCSTGGLTNANPCPYLLYDCSNPPPSQSTLDSSPNSCQGGFGCNINSQLYISNATPGLHNICYEYGIDPEFVSSTGGSPYACECPEQPVVGTLTTPSNYVISQYFLPNTQSGSFTLKTSPQPLSLAVTPQATLVKGQTVTFAIQSDQSLPTYMELSDPGNNIYCAYGGVPSGTYGVLADGLSSCPLNPTQGQLPCVLSFSNTNGKPEPGDAPTATISTQNLNANTYAVCGYEGNPPSSGTGADPWPVFFTSNEFVVVCPVTGCNGYIFPPAGPALTTSAVQQELCTLYFNVNEFLALLALVLALVGAILYSASNIMPGQTKGVMQGYAMGLVIAGVVSLIMATLSIYVLSVVSNVPAQNILLFNKCIA